MRSWVPLAIVLVWGSVAIVAPLLPLDPDRIELSSILAGPSAHHWLGFDELGRSIADRLIIGARTSFVVAVCVVSATLLVGSAIGVGAAYWGGWIDRLVVWTIDLVLAFPGILLAIVLAGVLGPGIDNVVLALSCVGWVGYARLARAQVLMLKHREHVVAARALGATPTRIMWQHLLPLISAPLLVEASFGVAGVIVGEAGLSFLGLGVQPPSASWGSMIRDGTRYMLVAPHVVLAPGFALMIVVLAVNLLGDQLRDWLDVKTKTVIKA